MNPIIILFIFGVAMSSVFGVVQVDDGEIPYISYFLVGAINVGLVTSSLVSATRIFLDRYIGMFEYLLSYPINRISIILGRLIFHIILSFIQIFLMILFVHFIEPTSIQLNVNLIIFIFFAVLGSCGWFCFTYLLVFSFKTQDSFNVMYYLIMTPVMYLSSIYYPIHNLPSIIKVLCMINPLTWSTDICRYFLFNIDSGYIYIKILLLFLFVIVTGLLLIKKLKCIYAE